MLASSMTLVVGGETVQVSRDAAEAIADHLWKGLEQGAVTAAARLTEVLRSDDRPGSREPLVFPDYETYAVRDALEGFDLPAGRTHD
jgi:hypothetical protein